MIGVAAPEALSSHRQSLRKTVHSRKLWEATRTGGKSWIYIKRLGCADSALGRLRGLSVSPYG